MNKKYQPLPKEFTVKEVLEDVNNGITLWDFALKYGLSMPERSYIFKFFSENCALNEKEAKTYLQKLFDSTTSYIKENPCEDELDYATLTSLANKGHSRIEMMKMYGYFHYSIFCQKVRQIIKESKADKLYKTKLNSKLRANAAPVKVKIILENEELEDSNSTILVATEETANRSEFEINSGDKEASDSKNTTDTCDEKSCCEIQNCEDKLIIYTVEYLTKQADNMDKIFNEFSEHVILSCTLNKFMDKNNITPASKIKLTEALNSGIAKVKIATSNYQLPNKKHTDISVENEVVLTEALVMAASTGKSIYIATCEPKTALNALSLGFGVRIPTNRVIPKFSKITDENLEIPEKYFDYRMPHKEFYNGLSSNSSNEPVVILDTCVIINNSGDTFREEILSDMTRIKVLTRNVLDELRECKVFFSTLFAIYCNPSIEIDLNTNLIYNYDDIAILNYAMYYRLRTGRDIEVLTHDWQFYLESLKYNIKTKFYPQTYMDSFKSSEEDTSEEKVIPDTSITLPDSRNIDMLQAPEVPETCNSNENTTELEDGKDNNESHLSAEEVTFTDDEEEEINAVVPVYYETVKIQMVSSKPVILHRTKIQCVKSSKTLEPIPLKGNKGYKYYPVELGDYVFFKNDPNRYEIISLTGKDNLKSVEFKSLCKFV